MSVPTDEDLQRQFVALVTQMVDRDCSLPDNFRLFYRVKDESSWVGKEVEILPYDRNRNPIYG